MPKAKGKFMSNSAYNQSSGKDDSPDQPDPYYSYDEVHSHHGSEEGGDMTGSVNSRSGEGIMGHASPGDPSIGKGK